MQGEIEINESYFFLLKIIRNQPLKKLSRIKLECKSKESNTIKENEINIKKRD